MAGTVPIPPDNAGKDEVIAALVANVEAMIRADRKIKALKELQVMNLTIFSEICGPTLSRGWSLEPIYFDYISTCRAIYGELDFKIMN